MHELIVLTVGVLLGCVVSRVILKKRRCPQCHRMLIKTPTGDKTFSYRCQACGKTYS